jgi:hypothetical protein
MAANMPFLGGVQLNLHDCAFAAAICALAALLTAATPIFRLFLEDGHDALADGGRGSASRFWRRIGSNLVVLELMVAVVLLASAGLLARSLYSLLHVPLGFDPAHLATVHVSIPATHSSGEFYQEIAERVGLLPGVEGVGFTSLLPVQCDCSTDSIKVVGKPELTGENEVDERHISPGYLPTIGAALIRGRLFTEADNPSRPGVAIINISLAQKYFPNEDPIGKTLESDS